MIISKEDTSISMESKASGVISLYSSTAVLSHTTLASLLKESASSDFEKFASDEDELSSFVLESSFEISSFIVFSAFSVLSVTS